MAAIIWVVTERLFPLDDTKNGCVEDAAENKTFSIYRSLIKKVPRWVALFQVPLILILLINIIFLEQN